MQYSTITTTCSRRTKTSGDAQALIGFQADVNDGIRIVSSLRDWLELHRENTLSLTSADGDISYALNANVDKVYQLRITSPVTYAKSLEHLNNFQYWDYWATKANQGLACPTAWYFTAPTIASTGAATYNVSFDQKPEQSYTVTYSYKTRAPTLTNDTDVPFFTPTFHHILVDYCLWKYAEREADPSLDPNYYRVSWENGLTDLLSDGALPQRQMTAIRGPQ